MADLVSIIITTYYRETTLRKAIESARSQQYEPVEIVVVDDSGEKHAKPIVEEYDVNYVEHETNQGQVAGWRTGLKHTSGKYVQFLDDDDILKTHKIANQVNLLEDVPDTGVVYCGVEYQGGDVELPPDDARGNVAELMLKLLHIPAYTSTLLIERDHLDAISPLPEYEAGTDIPLRIELAQRTEFDFLREPLVYRRVGSQGTSLAAIEARERILDEYADLYKQYPDSVRQEAIANASRFQGQIYLNHYTWSWKAIACFWRAVRAAPDFDPLTAGRLFASVFGAPGYKVSYNIYKLAKKLNSNA